MDDDDMDKYFLPGGILDSPSKGDETTNDSLNNSGRGGERLGGNGNVNNNENNTNNVEWTYRKSSGEGTIFGVSPMVLGSW